MTESKIETLAKEILWMEEKAKEHYLAEEFQAFWAAREMSAQLRVLIWKIAPDWKDTIAKPKRRKILLPQTHTLVEELQDLETIVMDFFK